MRQDTDVEFGFTVRLCRDVFLATVLVSYPCLFPIKPFTFFFWQLGAKALGIESQTLTNKKTGEELSLCIESNEIEIKRARKAKKKN